MITDEQKEFIKSNYSKYTYQEIANMIGLSKRQVGYCVAQLGIVKEHHLKLSEFDKNFIIDNYTKMRYSDIGKVVGLTDKQVKGWIYNHIENRKSKYRVFNDRYFKHIDTQEKAYWLGFIYADGWVSVLKRQTGNSMQYEFGIELQRRDEYILQLLNNSLGGVHSIKRSHRELFIVNNERKTISDTSELRVYSKSFVLDLINNGISIHKTRSNIYPVVKDELFIDFLRGYIDGDGCIHHLKNGLAVHITSANCNILKYIREKLISYGISSSIYHEDIDGYMTKYRLYVYESKSVKILLDLLYQNNQSLRLERKYKIYKDFYSLAI